MKLGDLVKIIGGGTPSRKNDEFWNGDIPWISVKDFKSNIINSSIEHITNKGLENSSAKLIPKGNLIVPTRMALGKVALNVIDTAINQDLKALIINDRNILDTKYLLYFLISKSEYIESCGKGATVKGITIDILESLDIPLPPINEQKKIVQVLDIAQSLVDKRKDQIIFLSSISQSLLIEMFGDPINSKWEKRLLKNIADVRDGTHDSPKYIDDGFPLVTSKNIKNDDIDLNNVSFISEEDYIKINQRSKVDVGDILMPMIGTIGNPVIVQREPNFAIKNVALIKFTDPSLKNIYLKELLNSYYLDFITQKSRRGGTQKFLSLSDIRNMEIPLPPIELQRKFSSRIKIIERQRHLFQKGLILLENNFNSLLHRAFKEELLNYKLFQI